MKVRILQENGQHVVDIEVVRGSWKNHIVCKDRDEALAVVGRLQRNWGAQLVQTVEAAKEGER